VQDVDNVDNDEEDEVDYELPVSNEVVLEAHSKAI
jgi:hypothetical protein